MENPNLFRLINQFNFFIKKRTQENAIGSYKSIFKSKGIEFEDFKPYYLGDDIRNIDWNVTARSNEPYIRNYCAERQLNVIIVVDISGSMNFGIENESKHQIALEITALLSFLAQKNRDNVGLLLCSNKVDKYFPPKSSSSHLYHLLKEISITHNTNVETDIEVPITFLMNVLKKRSIIFLISDFILDNYSRPLKVLTKKHDLVALHVSHPAEEKLFPAGHLYFKDSEHNIEMLINTSDEKLQAQYSSIYQQKISELNNWFKLMEIDYISIKTNQSHLLPLYQYLSKKAKQSS